jgi:hypothetical protein
MLRLLLKIANTYIINYDVKAEFNNWSLKPYRCCLLSYFYQGVITVF